MLLLVELLGYRAGWEAGAARKMLERPVVLMSGSRE